MAAPARVKAMAHRSVVYTIGHSAHDFDAFRRLLQVHGVGTVIDVRSQPYSNHNPVFSHPTLKEELTAAGLGYRFMGEHLGGRPAGPFTATGEPDWGRIIASPAFAGACDQVVALAAAGDCVLMCAEADPERCHRETVLAPALEERGLRVLHILADSSLRPHQPRLEGMS